MAFASLVLSGAPTVRWQEAGAIAVDGGTATITSIEGRDEMNRAVEQDQLAATNLDERIFDSMVAHDYLATEWALTPQTNLVRVSTGVGDGGYPVYVGFDPPGTRPASCWTSCCFTSSGQAPETHSGDQQHDAPCQPDRRPPRQPSEDGQRPEPQRARSTRDTLTGRSGARSIGMRTFLIRAVDSCRICDRDRSDESGDPLVAT